MKSKQGNPYPARIRKLLRNQTQSKPPKLTGWRQNTVREICKTVATKLQLCRSWLVQFLKNSRRFHQRSQKVHQNSMQMPVIDQKKIEEIQKLTATMTPGFAKLVMLLRESNIHEFEIAVTGGADKLVWMDSKVQLPSPTEEQLTNELMNILDQQYPPHNGFTFMNMIWNPNRAIAERMAKVVAVFRRRDRAQVEAQIVELLTHFKQGQ